MKQYFLRSLGIVILVLILILNLNYSVLKLLKMLADGDVESNHGQSFNISKVIGLSPITLIILVFHQAHPKFGHTAGIRCTCNSLYALVLSVLKRVSVWTTTDLYYVLQNGDCLCKNLNTNLTLM